MGGRSKNEGVIHSKVILVPQKMLNKTSNLKMGVWKLPGRAQQRLKFLHS